jgi:hypothetical protein
MHIEERHIIRMVKWRIMIWIEHLAHMGQRGMRLGFWWERQKDRDHLEYEDIGGRMILKWILERHDGMMWTGSVSGGLLWSFRCHKVLGISWVAKWLEAFQEVINSMELANRCGKNLLKYLGLLVASAFAASKYKSSCNLFFYLSTREILYFRIVWHWYITSHTYFCYNATFCTVML